MDRSLYDLLLVELFDVEYYGDVEMWVRGHSRSRKMVPFESLSMVSYLFSIVTMVVSLVSSELFSLEEWQTLKSGFGVIENGAYL